MTIGKREQIVVSVIVSIILVAVLHMLIFDPSQFATKKAKTNYDDKYQRIQTLRRASNQRVLDDFTSATQGYLVQLRDGIDELGLDPPRIFDGPDNLEMLAGIPPDIPPDEREEARLAYVDQLNKEKYYPGQLDLLLNEIERLRALRNSRITRMSFLAPGAWDIRPQLPQLMQTETLWDLITQITDTYNTLELLSEGDTYEKLERTYNKRLKALGIDVDRFEQLEEFGAFVPLYYKLAVANLIVNRMRADEQIIRQEMLTRNDLLRRLRIEIPYDPLAGRKENELYFAYEELRYLNHLLETAEQFSIPEITSARLWGYGFLREEPEGLATPDLEIVEPDDLPIDERLAYNYIETGDVGDAAKKQDAAQNASDPMGMFNLGSLYGQFGNWGFGAGDALSGQQKEEEEQREALTIDGDIGFALPVEISFRATNLAGFNYIYEVLRRNPMAELYRLSMESMSVKKPDDPRIQFKVIFVFVPKLFETMDTVHNMLAELKVPEPAPEEAAGAGQAPATLAPPAAAPALAPVPAASAAQPGLPAG